MGQNGPRAKQIPFLVAAAANRSLFFRPLRCGAAFIARKKRSKEINQDPPVSAQRCHGLEPRSDAMENFSFLLLTPRAVLAGSFGKLWQTPSMPEDGAVKETGKMWV